MEVFKLLKRKKLKNISISQELIGEVYYLDN